MKNKAYSILKIKSVDSEKRVIKGIASTPSIDRAGDTVNSMGAKFSLPLPLLLHHNHELPVGKVVFAEMTKEGIPFEAEIATIEEPGVLKDRTDEAWQSVESGLISAVSIGFTSDKYQSTKTGYNFEEWEWHELSLVTIPANREATIQTIKSLFNNGSTTDNKQKSAGVTAKYQIKQEKIEMKTYAEQIKALKAKKAENVAKLNEMAKKSVDAGETFDAKEQEEFDALTAENEALDGQVKRLEVLEKANAATATTVTGTSADEANRGTTVKNYATVASKDKMHTVGKAARAIAMAKGDVRSALEIAEHKYAGLPQVKELVQAFTKASVPIASTTNEDYLGVLSPAAGRDLTEFLDFVMPMSVLGQLDIPEIPFFSRWAEQTSMPNAYWVGEGARKPATSFTVSDNVLLPLKVANICVLTQEIQWDSSPKADAVAERSMGLAIAERLDIDFLDPAKAAVTGVSPASITNGLTPLVSTGNAYKDLFNLVNAVQVIAKSRQGVVVIVDDLTYQGLLFLRTDLGVPVFPELATQGTLFGIKVISSAYLRNFGDSSGGFAVALKQDDLRIAQSPGLIVKYSDQATVMVSDDGQTNPHYLFQENLLAVLVEKRINWTKARANSAVAYMTGINWANPV